MEYLLLVFVLHFAGVFCQTTSMYLVQSWKQFDFAFPSKAVRNAAIHNGTFVPANILPVDVDVDYHVPYVTPRTFVTLPRFSNGVPVTLGYVVQGQNGPLIQPYPAYSWHQASRPDCNGITSAFRVAIDSCFQMWVLDSGVIGSKQKCPPQLLVFDLATDKLLRRYRFPATQYTTSSLFITPVIDTRDPAPYGYCSDTKVYIADVLGFALIVYDYVTNKSWKIQHHSFRNDEFFSRITVAGESFDLPDGIFGLAVSPPGRTDRKLYYHSLAAVTENAVSLSVINNPANFKNQSLQSAAFSVIGSRDIQTTAQAMDSNGNLFFVLVNPLALVCWDSKTSYTRANIKIVYQNDTTLQFASGLKVVKNFFDIEEVWIMTSRFQKFAVGSMRADEINFRIQVQTIPVLLNNRTRCQGKTLS